MIKFMRYHILEFENAQDDQSVAEAHSLNDAEALFEIWTSKTTPDIWKIELYDAALDKILKEFIVPSKIKLLPCPFCGDTNPEYKEDYHISDWDGMVCYVECNKCLARSRPYFKNFTPDMVREGWNKRI